MQAAADQPAGWDRRVQENPPEVEEPSKAVAQRASIDIGLPVATLDEAFRLSNALAHSSLVPYALQGKGPDILAVLLYGRELGLTAWQSLNGINVIKGRPTMSAELRVAKTRQHGHRVGIVCRVCGEFRAAGVHRNGPTLEGRHQYVQDWDNTRCTVMTVRGDTGEQFVVTYTVDDAINAGLASRAPDGSVRARSSKGEKLPWEASTRWMVYARASSGSVRMAAPEVGYGLYTPEEVEDMEPVQVASTVGRWQVADADEPFDDEAVAATVRGMQVDDADV